MEVCFLNDEFRVFKFVVSLCKSINFFGFRVDLILFKVLVILDVIWMRFEVIIRLYFFSLFGGFLEMFYIFIFILLLGEDFVMDEIRLFVWLVVM